MMFMIGGTLLAILIGLIIGSARRDREQERAVRAVQDRLGQRYKPEKVFVSGWDQSAVGLNLERGVVVLSGADGDAEYPLAAIAEIEGLRDGTLLRRIRRGDAEPAGAAAGGGKGDVIRINTLDLRITVDDPARPVWIVRFFDWPAGGVSPGNVAFQAAARDAESWFRQLSDAIRPPMTKA
jgi:hypothetical protein